MALFNPVAKQLTATATEQSDSWTVSLSMPPRLPGGPILKGAAVVGVELGDRDSDPGQVPAANLKSLLGLVADAAHPLSTSDRSETGNRDGDGSAMNNQKTERATKYGCRDAEKKISHRLGTDRPQII